MISRSITGATNGAHRKDRFHQVPLQLLPSAGFRFYEADVANEPPHVHITKDGNEAKFWLNPIRVEREGRFRKSDLRDIERIIADNYDFLLDAWAKEKNKHVHG